MAKVNKEIAYFVSREQLNRAVSIIESVYGIDRFQRTVTIHKSIEELAKMERPCSNCMSYNLCAEDNYECSHFKMWAKTGYWDPTACSWK